MTGSARDRAFEAVQAGLMAVHGGLLDDLEDRLLFAGAAVDALLDAPDVLRAPDAEAIVERAKSLVSLYSLHPQEAEWESMTPQDAYKRGQVFAARYIAGVPQSASVPVRPGVAAEPIGERLRAAAVAVHALADQGFYARGLAKSLHSAGVAFDGPTVGPEAQAAVAAALTGSSPAAEPPALAAEPTDSPMLDGWDLIRARVTDATQRAQHAFAASERAASLADYVADELIRSGVLAAPAAVGTTPPDERVEVAENVPEHEALIAALKAAGWRRVGGRAGYYVRLRNDAAAPTVIVPVDPSAPDYRELMDAAHASVSAHPGVARVLTRCSEIDAEVGDGWLWTSEVRALLAGGEQP